MTATNVSRMTRIAGSHQIQWLDVPHRHHAVVEDQVKTNKAMGLHNLPSKSWRVNEGWMLTCNIAADLDAWLRLLTLHDQDDLAGPRRLFATAPKARGRASYLRQERPSQQMLPALQCVDTPTERHETGCSAELAAGDSSGMNRASSPHSPASK
ncbi:hypothetical protein [Streptomyces soliscabiei]|uniref:hypothetical protein n=1 Tax=Streptomyces soliscabiei TaxID=588897 RepID=UPI0029AD0BD1|nr:hypothetical protein [Streptomyces sp. NY05-11A]MDX2678531.1 hypothetical protein [Streptomyces sp. NY05-11A]